MASEVDRAIDWAVNIANDNSHGYDQGSRWGPDYDCSSFVISAYDYADVPVIKKGASTTSNMRPAFTKCGFKDVITKINLSTGEGLVKGDVLLNPGHHTALYIGDGQLVQASQNENGEVTGGKKGDQNGKEIQVKAYYNYPWDCVLRFPGVTSGETFKMNPKCNLKTWENIITVEKMENAFEGFLLGLEKLFIKWSIIYQINPALAAAIAMHETGNGSSMKARVKRNLFGIMTNGGRMLKEFPTFEAGIKEGIKNLSLNYLNKGINTISAIQAKYAPIGAENDPNGLNKNWINGVTSYYKKLTGQEPSDLGTGVASEKVASKNFNDMTAVEDANSSGKSAQKDITAQKIMAKYGEQMEARLNQFEGRKEKTEGQKTPDIELYIINWGGKIYKPVIEGSIEWETTYSGTPAQLSFTIVKDENIGFYEGSQVIFKYQSVPLFYGFVFKKSRDKDHRIKCVCYDQTRYLQNKDSLVYSLKTATEVIEMIAKDFSLKVGYLEDTKIKIPLRVEDNASLFNIIQYALDYTIQQSGEYFTFYDDFGKLTLKKSTDLKTNCIITKTTAQNFDYVSSINESTYTRIKKYYDNKETGIKEIYIYDESGKQPNYGVLQLCEKIDDNNIDAFKAGAEEQMKRELSQYSQPTRTLSIKGVFGDVMVRGGSLVCVSLNLGDIVVNSQESGNYFLCDSVKHTFSNGSHFMDVNLTGGGYRFI